MARKIFVEQKAKGQLRKAFKCSTMMVWKALNYQSDSELARKIRYVALKQHRGVPNFPLVEVETTHEEVERTMTQTFGERIRLVVGKDDLTAVVYIDGKADRRIKNISVPELMDVQQELTMQAAAL